MPLERWRYTIPLRVRSLLRRTEADQQLDDELRDHIERKIADYLSHGLSPAEARRRTLIELNGLEQVKEHCRDARGVTGLQDVSHDVRFGLRMLRKSPAFTVVAVLTFALGIGATTAVFSVVDRILFRSLPYPDAGRLVTYGNIAPFEPNEFVTTVDFAEWGNGDGAFASTTSWDSVQDCDLIQTPAAHLLCAHVDSTFLPTFGIQPLVGRNFTPAEDTPSGPKVALLFYNVWKGRFGGDPQVVGRTISIDGETTTIIGVLPRDFELPTLGGADVLVPEALDPQAFVRSRGRPLRILRAFARLAPGVTIPQARAAIESAFQSSHPRGFPKNITVSVRSLRDRQIGDARLAAWVLFGAVLAVLLIACANVANLILVRSDARQREFAIRATLGAGPARILRQTLTEGVLLAAAGSALGCGVAYTLLKLFAAISPQGIVHLDDASLDIRVLTFTLALSVMSGLFFGIASARRGASNDALYGRAASGFSRGLFRRALACAQIAVSFVLLAGAGLLMRSLDNLERVPLGMDASGVVTATISLNPHLYASMSRRESFFESVEQHLRLLPGISAFALCDSVPPSGRLEASAFANIEVRGRSAARDGTGSMVGYSTVTPGYFSALAITIVRGRPFVEEDRGPNARVAILNSVLAKRVFPNGDAVGKQLRFQPNGDWLTVVGVSEGVKSVQGDGFVSPAESEYYLPLRHSGDAHAQIAEQEHVILRTSLDPAAVALWMRATLASLDPTVPVTVDSMSERVGTLEARPRFNAALLGMFAAFGILLAALGTYGVLAFLVVQRTREIGLRLALGTPRRDVMAMILAGGAKLALVGIILGAGGAFAVTRSMRTLLFGVTAADPMTFLGVVIVLAAAALLASYLPARRAMRVDPMVALKYE